MFGNNEAPKGIVEFSEEEAGLTVDPDGKKEATKGAGREAIKAGAIEEGQMKHSKQMLNKHLPI